MTEQPSSKTHLGLPRLRAFVSSMMRTAVRFPLPLACAALATSLALVNNHLYPETPTGELLVNFIIPLALGFFMSLAVALLVERRGLRSWGGLIALGGFLLLAVKMFLSWGEYYGSSDLFLFLAPALALSVGVAPFVATKSDDLAFWEFNRAIWWGFLFGLVMAVVLFLGVRLAFKTVENLFGIDIGGTIYIDALVVACGIVWPWLALTRVPKHFDTPAANPCPKWLLVLTSNVLVPLSIIYLAILYAYAIRVLLGGDLPKGKIGFFVASYATFGVVTHLLTYPLLETRIRLVGVFHRHFHHALIVPIILLGVAIIARISEHGVTEQRYGIMLLTLWLVVITISFFIWRGTRAVFVPLSLAVLLFLGSFGPWGAYSVSKSSQVARLEILLSANGLLAVGGKSPAPRKVSRRDEANISSIVRYLRHTHKLGAIRPWFAGMDFGETDPRGPSAEVIVAAMGLNYADGEAAAGQFEYENPRLRRIGVFGSDRPDLVDIAGFRTLAHVRIASGDKETWSKELVGAGLERYLINFDRTQGRLTVTTPHSNETLRFDVATLAKHLGRNRAAKSLESNMVLEESKGTLRARIHFLSVKGKVDGETARVNEVSFLLLIGRADAEG